MKQEIYFLATATWKLLNTMHPFWFDIEQVRDIGFLNKVRKTQSEQEARYSRQARHSNIS
jgi:hypothetical protein